MVVIILKLGNLILKSFQRSCISSNVEMDKISSKDTNHWQSNYNYSNSCSTKGKTSFVKKNQEFCMFNSSISTIEPKMVKMALNHSNWVEEMQIELHEFERNKVWCLIRTPPDASVVGLKWVLEISWIKKEIWCETKLDHNEWILSRKRHWLWIYVCFC